MENTYIETDLDVVKYLDTRTCEQILDMLEGKNLIGKGFWGFVYKLDIKGHKISVKIQPTTNTKTWDPTIIDPRDIGLEIKLLKLLSQYKITNSFIHFPYFYKELECNEQKLMFYEYYDKNLKDLLLGDYTFEDFKNISFQILICIWYFQKVTGYFHNDIHVENFLVNKLSGPIEQNYQINQTKKTFIYNKFYIGIWDYANAQAIPKNFNSKSDTNTDYVQFKQMFVSFIKKILDKVFRLKDIEEYCIDLNSKSFDLYYSQELKANKLKWSHIKNPTQAVKKISNSLKKSILYWIIENKQLDIMIEHFKKTKQIDPNLNLPTSQMLQWIQDLPDNLEVCLLEH
jgi:hypothetical protein